VTGWLAMNRNWSWSWRRQSCPTRKGAAGNAVSPSFSSTFLEIPPLTAHHRCWALVGLTFVMEECFRNAKEEVACLHVDAGVTLLGRATPVCVCVCCRSCHFSSVTSSSRGSHSTLLIAGAASRWRGKAQGGVKKCQRRGSRRRASEGSRRGSREGGEAQEGAPRKPSK
jgi:hypothetical protein